MRPKTKTAVTADTGRRRPLERVAHCSADRRPSVHAGCELRDPEGGREGRREGWRPSSVTNPSTRLVNDSNLNRESNRNQMIFCLIHESNRISLFKGHLNHELNRIILFKNFES